MGFLFNYLIILKLYFSNILKNKGVKKLRGTRFELVNASATGT